jgi:hypothetical protein
LLAETKIERRFLSGKSLPLKKDGEFIHFEKDGIFGDVTRPAMKSC